MGRLVGAVLLALCVAGPARAQTPADAASDTKSDVTSDAVPTEPTPEALAQAWFDQLFGGDIVQFWQTDWAGGTLNFGVARRWIAGRPEIFVHILAPRAYEELNFLLRERDEQRIEILYYRTPEMFPAGRKAARVMPIANSGPLERLPFAPGLPAIVTLLPSRADDYTWKRLADVRTKTVDCRLIEGAPRKPDLGFDRIVLALDRKTGVALDTRWFLGASLVRHVTSAATDVRDEGGRFLAKRYSVEQPGNETQIYVSTSLMLDPAFPEQQFTTQNLKAGRFPTY